jgi:hypothetical protein
MINSNRDTEDVASGWITIKVAHDSARVTLDELTEPGTVDKTASCTEPGMVVNKIYSCTLR